MYDLATRKNALGLLDSGLSLNQVSRRTGISRSSIRSWRTRLHPLPEAGSPCPLTDGRPAPGFPARDYAYLLGLYLGDGCVSRTRGRVHSLRIACSDAWPGLIEECAAAVAAVMPENRVQRAPGSGCTYVGSWSVHWPCLFPQHGPGRKHERVIELAPWQQAVVDEQPWPLIRGLIHSDGCRIINWTVRRGRRYEYPRYFFTNCSVDIRRVLTAALDRVGVEWKETLRGDTPYSAGVISIAKRGSVELMDAHVGAKY